MLKQDITEEKIEPYEQAFFIAVNDIRIGQVLAIGRFGDWTWSYNVKRIDPFSITGGIVKTKELALKELLMVKFNGTGL